VWNRNLVSASAMATIWLLAGGAVQAAQWFGQPLPPPVSDPTKRILPAADDLPAQPAIFGPGPTSPLLSGDRIKADVATIIGFSLESRAAWRLSVGPHERGACLLQDCELGC
jgi:hypothetical protein